MRRLKGLTDDLIRELIPDIGLRIDLFECLKTLKSEASESRPNSFLNDNKSPGEDKSEPVFITPLGNLINQNQFVISDSPPLQLLDSEFEIISQHTLTPNSESTIVSNETNNNSSAIPSGSDSTSDEPKSDSSCRKRKRNNNSIGSTKHLHSFAALEFIQNLDFKDYLSNYNLVCVNALNHQNIHGCLLETHRNAISSAIANALLKHNANPGVSECLEAAKKICIIFPQEKQLQ